MHPARRKGVSRRAFLAGAVATAAASRVHAQSGAGPIPVVDTHIHLFDQTRPQGAPYTSPLLPGATPQPALPDRYRRLATPLGIVGAIEIEASPWIEDNLWVLQVAQTDPIMVGTVGNLEPDKPEFAEYLTRYQKNPLFRGIRYGNLWGRELTTQVDNAVFIDGLKLLAQADLVLDTANPRVNLLQAIVRITDKVPDLRIVLDHLPGLEPTAAERSSYDAVIAELQKRPNVFAKLSAVIHRIDGQLSTALSPAYRDRLDHLIEVFGEDRVVFGSDWPNSDGVAPLDQVVAVVKDYFSSKSRAVAEKYFWRNSVKAYKWVKRDASQPGPGAAVRSR